jgi:hypothetical protein
VGDLRVGSRDTQAPKSPVDRLVEAGLAAYGRGELDDALVAWEQALALDPEDTRALGYVDYVRQHYELVAAGAGAAVTEEDLGVPFGLGDDDGDYGDYEIEVTPAPPPRGIREAVSGDAPTVRVPSQPPLEGIDEGWGLDDDPRARAMTVESPGLTLELEADEPPADFETDSTSEYVGRGDEPRRRRGTPSSPGFLPSEHKTPGTDEFPALDATTGLGQRALGFVQPKEPASRASAGRPSRPNVPTDAPAPPSQARARRPSNKPELKVTIRTPTGAGDDADEPLGHQSLEAAFEAQLDASFSPTVDPTPVPPERVGSIADVLEPPDPVGDLDLDPLPPPPSAGTAGLLDDDDALGPAMGEPVPDDAPAHSSKPTLDFGERSEGPTRDLGLRTAPPEPERSSAQRAPTVDDPTTTSRTRTQEARLRILADVDRGAPANEAPDARTKRRIAALIELGQAAARAEQLEKAVLAIDAAFSEDPDSAAAHKLIQQNRDAIFSVFHDFLGDLERRPQLAMPLHQVIEEPLDPRAAFLLSRVDGSLTYEELLDVSGMPRLEAGRYLCQLVLRGLLRAE